MDGGTERFIVRVDSIIAPDTVAPDGAFPARFIGLIGPNGCYSLVGVPTGRSPGLLQIQFNGEVVDRVCTQEPVLLDYSQVIAPPFLDPFMIRVTQPSGPPLEKIVRIR